MSESCLQWVGSENWSRWTRFWHQPIRAERLAVARIVFAGLLLADQMVQYLPNLAYFYGPEGVCPEGIADGYLLRTWRWTALFFATDNMLAIYAAFWVWVSATVALLLGWRTRIASIVVWLMTMCFVTRNIDLKNGGDDLLQVVLLLLMVSPCGQVLSLDWLRKRRQAQQPAQDQPVSVQPVPVQPVPVQPVQDHPRAGTSGDWMTPWPVRLFQLQLCVVYLTSGVAKLFGRTWWEGTSLHYVLNDVTMTRWSYAQWPIPLWITAPLTYFTLIFEVFFPLLVFFPRTRMWTLLAGLCFHLGIYALIEVGWFSFYTMAMYVVWIPDAWWCRRRPDSAPQKRDDRR